MTAPAADTADSAHGREAPAADTGATGPADAAPRPGPEPTRRGVLRWAFRTRRRWIVSAAVCTAVHQMCEAAVPVVVGAVVDHALDGGSSGALVLWIGVLGALFLVLTTAMRLGGRCNRQGSQGAAHALRMVAVTRILDARGFAGTGRASGDLLSTATADSLRVGLGNRFWVLGGGAVAALAFGAGVLLLTSVPLGLLVLAGLVPLLALTQLLAKPLAARSGAEQARVAEATSTAADLVRGLRVVKGLGAERAARGRYRTASRSSLAATVRAARWDAAHQGVTLLLNGLFLTVVTWAGARFALEGSLSVGEFVSSVGLAQFLIGPCNRFAGAVGLRARARGSAQRLATLLAAPYAVDGGRTAPEDSAPGPELAVEDLEHGPLHGLRLDVPAGMTGLVTTDPQAAGALLDVLALRVAPAAGRVRLDGAELARMPLATTRARLLVADHDGDLFDGTVAENVTVAAAREAVPRALAAAGADQVLAVLPDGEESRIGERGRRLSGGQRQRVALARALAADPPALVLHEPTTAVDPATEDGIARGLREHRAGRTTLLVTTSPILLSRCDRVIFLDGDAVAAEGTHDTLLHESPAYRTMVTA